jgi:hypothetical protein
MALLFSYGTLQETPVQIATFGRVLEGVPDSLTGYERVSLTFTDPALIASSGKALHANIEHRGRNDVSVTGTRLSVTEDELVTCDAYEDLARYRRHRVTLDSGEQAWVYAFAGTHV